MSRLIETLSLGDIPAVGKLLDHLNIDQPHPIPFFKILFTLHRKSFTNMILIEGDPANKQYEDECSVAGESSSGLMRLH